MGDQSTECDEASQSTGQDSHYEEEYDLDSTSSEEEDDTLNRPPKRRFGVKEPQFQAGSNEIDSANVVHKGRRAPKPSSSTTPSRGEQHARDRK